MEELVLHEEKKKELPSWKTIVLIGSLSLSVLGVAFAVYFFVALSDLKSNYKKLQLSSDSLQNKTVTLQTSIDEQKKVITIEEFNKLKFQTELNDRINYFNSMQHRVEGGTVTGDFVVEKFTVIAIPTIKEGTPGILDTTIDLSTQPSMSAKYKGQGLFTLSDRELKAAVAEVLSKVKTQYAGSEEFYKGLPKWDDGTHLVTIKNYEIGTFSGGQFKLKGE